MDNTPSEPDIAKIAAGLTKAQLREAKAIANSMPKDARSCILNWADGKTPVPDSVWHGCYSHLKRHAAGSANRFVLSPLGLAVQAHLKEPTP